LNYVTDREKIQGYFKFLIKITYLVQFPIFIFVAAVPEQIIRVVFGGKFIEYKFLLVAAFAFPVIYAFHRPLTIIAQLGERAGIILASKVFAAYNVVAALALIPKFGAYGALMATGSAQVFKNIFIWFFVRKVATFKGTGYFFTVQTALWLLCWGLIQYAISGLGDVQALVVAVVLVGVFSLAGIRLAAFDAAETRLIYRIAGPRASTALRASKLVPG